MEPVLERSYDTAWSKEDCDDRNRAENHEVESNVIRKELLQKHKNHCADDRSFYGPHAADNDDKEQFNRPADTERFKGLNKDRVQVENSGCQSRNKGADQETRQFAAKYVDPQSL